ncbi:hypothetical protein BH09PSE6_BH09PSE6_22460 [soil metagenome]
MTRVTTPPKRLAVQPTGGRHRRPGKAGSVMALAFSVLALSTASVAAETYQCDVGGRITYTDQPCTSGRQSRVAGPSLETDAVSRAEARERNAELSRRADDAVAAARERADEDSRRRAAIAIADRNAETERLRRDAAEYEQSQLIVGPRIRPYRPPLNRPRPPPGFSARGNDGGGTSVTVGR